MRITKNLNVINKEKIIVWSIIGIIGIISLGLLIGTSWYSFDKDASEKMYKAMDIMFFRVWAAYTITDGYVSIASFFFPVCFIGIESFFAWRRVKNKDSILGRFQSNIKWLYFVLITLWAIVMAFVLYSLNYVDQGFGNMFSMEFILTPAYMWPIISIIFLVNMAYVIITCWIVRTKVAPRKDFLERKLWVKSLAIIIFTIVIYIPVIILKPGMGRPYYYSIIWDRVLNKVNDIDHNAYEHYIKVGYEHHLDWTSLSDQDWPWWKIGTGDFGPTVSAKEFTSGEAFPSGHIASTSSMCMSVYFLLGANSKSKKFNRLKWILIGIASVYLLDVVFALQTSLSHWLSDIVFTLAWMPISLIISKYVSIAIGNISSKRNVIKIK